MLDIHPILEKVLFINGTQLANQMVLNYEHIRKLEEQPEDNICIYVPLDLSCNVILRCSHNIYYRYRYLIERIF